MQVVDASGNQYGPAGIEIIGADGKPKGGGGGGVMSVTGLDTDNTDPANPVVQIAVDGVTITGDGTPGNPLVSGSAYILRHSFASPLDYIGLAPTGTAESSPVWNITRLTTTLSGTSLSQTAVGAWTNRTSLIYT